MNLRWYLNRKLGPRLRVLYDRLTTPPAPNDLGHRDIEYSYIAAHMPNGPGKALDFGCGNSWMGLLAARKGFETVGVDLIKPSWMYNHHNLAFKPKEWADQFYDVIITCSVIENLGVGRYWTDNPAEEDEEVMRELHKHLNPGHIMLLTTQIGIPKVVPYVHRIYGVEQLKDLFQGFRIENSEYWMKNGENKWFQVYGDIAFQVEGNERYYALGLFTLVKE